MSGIKLNSLSGGSVTVSPSNIVDDIVLDLSDLLNMSGGSSNGNTNDSGQIVINAADLIPSTFSAKFSPPVVLIPRSAETGIPSFVGINPTLSADNNGTGIQFVLANSDSDVSFVNNTWRIGSSETSGISDIVYKDVVFSDGISVSGLNAVFSNPASMSAQSGYVDVPVRYKTINGKVIQGSNVKLQLTFADSGAAGQDAITVDISGFTSFAENAGGGFYPPSSQLTAIVSGITNPVYGWTVVGATFPENVNSSSITISPNSNVNFIDASLHVSGDNVSFPISKSIRMPVVYSGQPGQAGANGVMSAFPTIYKWTNTATTPDRPNSSSTYTWLTGTFAAPIDWDTKAPAVPGQGYYLWSIVAALNVSATTQESTINWSNTTFPIRAIAYTGTDGADGSGSITGVLSNDSHTLPANSNGDVTSFIGATTTMYVFIGDIDDSNNWTYSCTYNNVTSIEGSSSRTQTISTFSNASDSGYVDITASKSGYASITKRFSLSKVRQGNSGADSIVYYLQSNTVAINKNSAGILTPSSVVAELYKVIGNSAPVLATGIYFRAYESTDGATFVLQKTENAASSITYTPTTNAKIVRIRAYLDSGFNNLLDTQTYVVVSDGAKGDTGAAGSTGSATFVITRVANDSSAPTNAEVAAIVGRTPVSGDIVTVSYNNFNNAVVYRYVVNNWALFTTYITGSLIVENTITGNKLVANTVSADKIDARGLSIKDANGNIILAAGSAIDYTKLGGASANLTGLGYTGDLNATRNVYKGSWATATAYVVGDIVLDGSGYGWSCISAHTSSATIKPPTYPVTSNTYWTLYTVKGDAGSNAKTVTLSASSQVFQISKSGTVTPSIITLTANGQNLLGSPTFSVTSGTVVLSGSGTIRNISYSDLATDSATIQVTWDSLTDYITVVKVREGIDGTSPISGYLTNESVTVPTASDGSGGVFTSAGGTLKVFDGVTDKTGNAAVTYSIASSSGVTISIAATGVYTVTGMSADTGTATIRAVYNSVTVDKIYTIAKAKAGVAGSNSKYVDLTVGSQSFVYNSSGTTPSPVSTTVTATANNIVGTAYYEFLIGSTSKQNTTANTYTYTPQTLYSSMPEQITVKVREGSTTGTVVATDIISMIGIKPGGDGAPGLGAITVVISNEAQILPADSSGIVTSYSGSGFTVEAYEGTTKLTASSTATTSAFRVGTITQSPLNTINIQTPTYSGNTITVADHSSMVSGTDYVYLTIPITVYRADGTSSTITKVQTIAKSKTGLTGISNINAILSNEAHVFPATTTGSVTNYTNSGTTLYVYYGADYLTFDGTTYTGTETISNGTWRIKTPISTSNISVGTISDSGVYATIGQHSGVSDSIDVALITYEIVGKTQSGTQFTINKQQTFSKAKTGAQGPSVIVTANRPTTFTATDGVLDSGQSDITFTASVSGVSNPTYTWSFSGLQTNPTASTTNTQTITAAQFGTAKSAIITCTVGAYSDVVTIVRLEKSTAAAGATVGADSTNLKAGTGVNLVANPSLRDSISPWQAYINTGAGRTGTITQFINNNGAPAGYGSVQLSIVGSTSTTYDDSVHLYAAPIPCTPGERLELQAKVQVFRGNAQLQVTFLGSNNVFLGSYLLSGGNSEAFGDTAWSTNISDFVQLWGFSTVPSSAIKAYIEVRVKRTQTTQSTDLYVTQPYIGRATAIQTTPSPWVDSIPYISGANASTYIANAAIGSAQIGSIALVGTSNFSVKTAKSGARIEMDSRFIKVYDSNGILRVQLGDLSL